MNIEHILRYAPFGVMPTTVIFLGGTIRSSSAANTNPATPIFDGQRHGQPICVDGIQMAHPNASDAFEVRDLLG